MNSISPNLNIMIKASEKASKVLIRDFGELEKLQVSKKGPKDFVTNADKKVEKILIEELLKYKKKFSILSEEAGYIKNNDETKIAANMCLKHSKVAIAMTSQSKFDSKTKQWYHAIRRGESIEYDLANNLLRGIRVSKLLGWASSLGPLWGNMNHGKSGSGPRSGSGPGP